MPRLCIVNNKLDERERQHKVLAPKAEYYDALADKDLLTNLRDTANMNENVIPLDRVSLKFQEILKASWWRTCSSTAPGGIKPIYAPYYTRTTQSLHGTEELPDYIVTARTCDYTEHISMQSA